MRCKFCNSRDTTLIDAENVEYGYSKLIARCNECGNELVKSWDFKQKPTPVRDIETTKSIIDRIKEGFNSVFGNENKSNQHMVDTKTYEEKGIKAGMSGDHKKAAKYFTLIIEAHKNEKNSSSLAKAYGNRGLSYEELGYYTNALKDYTKAIEIKSEWVFYFNRARTYMKTEQFEKAISEYNQVIYYKNKSSESIYLIPQTKNSEQNDKQIHTNMGYANLRLRNLEKAMKHYSEAIELEFTEEWELFLRGECSMKREDIEKALKDPRKARQTNIKLDEPNRFGHGQEYISLNTKDPIDTVNVFIKSRDIFFSRSFCHFESKEFDKAIDDITAVIESNPQDAELFFTRGTCFDKLGQFHKALEDYNKVIEIDPSDQDAINNRRMLLEEHPELKP